WRLLERQSLQRLRRARSTGIRRDLGDPARAWWGRPALSCHRADSGSSLGGHHGRCGAGALPRVNGAGLS
uniref:Uncharacterized protein n=1 Tax=Strigops habroptila TaxID=2489341 RepID=A0A672V910_STRHB